jgi:hypothetical protein
MLVVDVVAHDATGERVDDHRHVEPCLPRAHARDVAQPHAVGLGGREVLLQHIRRIAVVVLRPASSQRGGEHTARRRHPVEYGCHVRGDRPFHRSMSLGRHEKPNPRFKPSVRSLSALRSNHRASFTSRSVALLSSRTAHASCTTSTGITNPVGAQNGTLSRATAHSLESQNPGKRSQNAIADWAPEAEVRGSNPSASAMISGD